MTDEHTGSGEHSGSGEDIGSGEDERRPAGSAGEVGSGATGGRRGSSAGSGSAGASGEGTGTGSARDAEAGGAGERAGRERSWSRGSAFTELQETVSEIVEGAMRSFTPMGSPRFPRYDLVRIPEEGYRLLFDLPGVARADLEVGTVGDELSVSGVRHRPTWGEGSEVLRSERSYGRFRRTLRLPADVDATEVRARLEEGVLVVTLPHRKESSRQKVEVETGPGRDER